MSSNRLGQSELEQIVAWLDGELSLQEAGRVAARVQSHPAWSAAAREFRQLDQLLDGWQAPALPRDLTGKVLAKARRKPGLPAWVRLMAPLAAAAAIVLIAVAFHAMRPATPATTGGAGTVAKANPAATDDLARVAQNDQFLVENLDLFQDYDVLKDFATLKAMDELERQSQPDGI